MYKCMYCALYHTMNELRNQTRTKERNNQVKRTKKIKKIKTTMNTPHSMPKGQRATETVYTHTVDTPERYNKKKGINKEQRPSLTNICIAFQSHRNPKASWVAFAWSTISSGPFLPAICTAHAVSIPLILIVSSDRVGESGSMLEAGDIGGEKAVVDEDGEAGLKGLE